MRRDGATHTTGKPGLAKTEAREKLPGGSRKALGFLTAPIFISSDLHC